MDIWAVATLWLLWMVPLWSLMYKFLCRHVFLILLGKYLGVELLGHVVTLLHKSQPPRLSDWTRPPLRTEISALCSGCPLTHMPRCGHASRKKSWVIVLLILSLFSWRSQSCTAVQCLKTVVLFIFSSFLLFTAGEIVTSKRITPAKQETEDLKALLNTCKQWLH